MDDLTRLAVAAGDGDRVALAAFVRLSQGEVWRLCAHLVDRCAADDLTQDVYLRAIDALRSFRADASARTWLLTIARRACADAIRRRTRRRAFHERYRPARTRAADHAPHVELDVLIAGLADDRRTAFVLTQIIGLRYDEAAAVCGCPTGTIRSRVARARADLIDAVSREEQTG